MADRRRGASKNNVVSMKEWKKERERKFTPDPYQSDQKSKLQRLLSYL